MKIIVSPTKTLNLCKNEHLQDKELLFPSKQKKVLAALRKLSKKDLATALTIKGDILDKTYTNIKNYTKNETYHAFSSFSGLVFFNLDKENYFENEYSYISKNIVILDAFYGILEPGTLIKPYRLDMKAKIGINLYNHWDVDSYFDNEVIINLASTEFSSMIDNEMISINFLQNKNGNFINQATYSKQARGLCLDYMIKNKIENIEEIKGFNADKYQYNESLSNESNITFTR